jgi:hypothetical protein
MAQKAANQAENREKLKLKTPPEQTQCKLSPPPLDKQYKVFSLNHPVSKEFYQLCAHSLPFWQ